MAMQMQRAFNAKFLTPVTHYSVSEGHFDDDNVWIDGATVPKKIRVRILSGNKFSQFEEGEAVINTEGGVRHSDYREIYVPLRYPVKIGDKIGYKSKYFNILQRSDEDVYGFNSYLIERSENWEP